MYLFLISSLVALGVQRLNWELLRGSTGRIWIGIPREFSGSSTGGAQLRT